MTDIADEVTPKPEKEDADESKDDTRLSVPLQWFANHQLVGMRECDRKLLKNSTYQRTT